MRILKIKPESSRRAGRCSLTSKTYLQHKCGFFLKREKEYENRWVEKRKDLGEVRGGENMIKIYSLKFFENENIKKYTQISKFT